MACIAVLFVCLVPVDAWAAATQSVSSDAVDAAAIAALPTWHGTKATVLLHLDLTRPFAAVSQWTLVVASEPGPSREPQEPDAGIAVCLVHVRAAHCSSTYDKDKNSNALWWYRTMFDLDAAKVVYAGHGKTQPLLLVRTDSGMSMDGGRVIRTTLYAYNRQADAFRQAFVAETGSNNNQETRFVTRGPLRGDVIVARPTDDAPYTYWIEVYARSKSGAYARILRYRGHTGYNDGNPLAVIDSERPAILEHLGLWHSGDPLPVPLLRPHHCTHFVLRHHEEWCR